jgi:hypothetical protein
MRDAVQVKRQNLGRPASKDPAPGNSNRSAGRPAITGSAQTFIHAPTART